jgi:virginiamycin B lyase
VYWANNHTIGRAKLDGTGVNQRFITGADSPDALAIDSKRVYWANFGSGTIGRTNLNATGVNQRFLIAHSHPGGVAIASGR